MKRIIIIGLLLSAIILPAWAQQPTATDAFKPIAQCADFAAIATRASLVHSIQDISQEEFNIAMHTQGAIIKILGNVFELGQFRYVKTQTDGKDEFKKFGDDKAMETAFVAWYNKGGQEELLQSENSCANTLVSNGYKGDKMAAMYEYQMILELDFIHQIIQDSDRKAWANAMSFGGECAAQLDAIHRR